MSNNNSNKEKKSDRLVATVTGIDLAEKIRQSIKHSCKRPFIQVFLYFDNSLDVAKEDKTYNICVTNEWGSKLDDTRFNIAYAKACEIISGSIK